jgi:hypothetical protein
MIYNNEIEQQLRMYEIKTYKLINNKWIKVNITFEKTCYPDYLHRVKGGIKLINGERYYKKIIPINIFD